LPFSWLSFQLAFSSRDNKMGMGKERTKMRKRREAPPPLSAFCDLILLLSAIPAERAASGEQLSFAKTRILPFAASVCEELSPLQMVLTACLGLHGGAFKER
jgi:hypothetical protein